MIYDSRAVFVRVSVWLGFSARQRPKIVVSAVIGDL